MTADDHAEALRTLAGRARRSIEDGIRPEAPTTAALVRRGRRRATARLAVVAVLLMVLGGAGVALSRPGDEASDRVATEPSPSTTEPELTITPTRSWTQGELLRDSRTLRIPVLTDPTRDDDVASTCAAAYGYEVLQAPASVTVAIYERRPAPTGEDRPCLLMAITGVTDIVLDEPLGDRPVFDGINATPRRIDRRSELVGPTYLPPGFTAESEGVNELAFGGVQLTYGPGDPQTFSLSIVSYPAGRADPPPADAVPISVRGRDGWVFPSFAGSTVQWSEGGYDLAVWGEGAAADEVVGALSGATTYVPEDELLAVAEGLVLPG